LGKRIRAQRRGRGSVFKSSTHKRLAPSKYKPLLKEEREQVFQGEIISLLHDPGRGSPLALIRLETGETYYAVTPEGSFEGQKIEYGDRASISIGNVISVGKIPEGTMICNVELSPGDGGKMVRSSGMYATVISHTSEGTILKLPSDKTKYFNDLCLATIGVVSGTGRTEKPLVKAGSNYYLHKAKGHKYPRTRGRAMIAAVHPFGSGRRGARKGTTVSHGAPPGRKVGLIAASRAGRKRKK
jgi:large subunit ribosomal protein L2